MNVILAADARFVGNSWRKIFQPIGDGVAKPMNDSETMVGTSRGSSCSDSVLMRRGFDIWSEILGQFRWQIFYLSFQCLWWVRFLLVAKGPKLESWSFSGQVWTSHEQARATSISKEILESKWSCSGSSLPYWSGWLLVSKTSLFLQPEAGWFWEPSASWHVS